ncbi:hypothetical protein IFM46972_10226 [Aspergillus udagawae]|uniref:Uncharacterized protein n=1 Tax=Aspergillus udagawae TaxID=91492 RepID=A0A8H3SAX3_9EURO|nr:hypothetical protein IFM46972_10226 [Aspergillus udagawae]
MGVSSLRSPVLPHLLASRHYRPPEYLQGQDLAAVVLLGCLPNPAIELILIQFSASIKQLINQAYQVIKDGHLNKLTPSFASLMCGTNPSRSIYGQLPTINTARYGSN